MNESALGGAQAVCKGKPMRTATRPLETVRISTAIIWRGPRQVEQVEKTGCARRSPRAVRGAFVVHVVAIQDERAAL